MYAGGGHYDGAGGAANSNALFAGGGYMPSQTTNTPEGGGGGFKTRGVQTLLPLTVKQIMDASQANDDKSTFAVDGTEVSTVRLVGRILNKVERVTDVAFTLDDGTGSISVNRWENESIDTKEMKEVHNGDYVIVSGSLRGFQGKRQVVAFSVRPVNNFNDVTHHFLHCIYVHLDLTRSKRSLLQPQVNVNVATANPNQTMPRNDMAWKQAQHPNNQDPTFPKLENTTGTDLQNLVLSAFSDPAFVNLEHGITMNDVKTRINLPDDVLRRTLNELLDGGSLYSTIDEEHFKSIVNG